MEIANAYAALSLPARKSAAPAVAASMGADISALTSGLVQGDEGAYRQFFADYSGRLYRYLIVASQGQEHAAREALQETMRRVVKHARKVSDEQVFWSWLTVLARSALFDGRRKRRRYGALLLRFQDHLQVQNQPDRDDADTRLLRSLLTHVDLLEAGDRDLVERKYFRQERVQDIAEALRLSEKAVESRLTRARSKLRTAILNSLKGGPADES